MSSLTGPSRQRLIQGRLDEPFLACAECSSTGGCAPTQRYVPRGARRGRVRPAGLRAPRPQLRRAFLCIGTGRPEAQSHGAARQRTGAAGPAWPIAEFFWPAALGPSPARNAACSWPSVTSPKGWRRWSGRAGLEWLAGLLLEPCFAWRSPNGQRTAGRPPLQARPRQPEMVGEFPELQGVMGGQSPAG